MPVDIGQKRIKLDVSGVHVTHKSVYGFMNLQIQFQISHFQYYIQLK